MAAAAEEPQRLSELLESGWRLLEEVESSAEASSGAPAVQRKVQHGIGLLERAARAIAELQLFSRNEELDEVASADLRFMLVPALLGALVLKQQPGGGAAAAERRLEHVQRARGLFLDFLRLCADYGVGPTEMPAEEPGEPRQREREGGGGLEAAAARRRAKIERYKQKKEVENQLASLKTLIDRAQAEEEQLREFYLLHIRKWVSTSLEEIESIDQEIEILTQRDALKQRSGPPPSYPPRPPQKPFILTRDAAQAKVFGSGYPSLATMTVDDWYQQHRQQCAWPDQGTSRKASAGAEEQQKEQEEKKTEEEEEEALEKAREWDDWKDLHPRGYGNRKNMG